MTVARTFEDYEDLVCQFSCLISLASCVKSVFVRLQAMALLLRPSALARARASLRNCRAECNLFRTRDVWVPNWEVRLSLCHICFMKRCS